MIHNPEVPGSSPGLATKIKTLIINSESMGGQRFFLCMRFVVSPN